MYHRKKQIGVVVYLLWISATICGCKKFVEIAPPVTSITGATVYSNNTTAAAAMTGIYDNMEGNYVGLSDGINSISLLVGLEADELTNYSPTTTLNVQFYTNSLSSSTSGASNPYFWQELYNEIYATNAVLEGVNTSENLTDSIKRQLVGEAEFMRAFLHFYATNLYGDVPLVTTINYKINNTLSRTPQAQVYQQIVADLTDAQQKLSGAFVNYQGLASTQRIRPNQGAATALLARVYLYLGNYDSAAKEASALINNTSLYSLDTLNGVFLANSNEAIWQLEPVTTGSNTLDAQAFDLTTDPGTSQGYVSLSPNLESSFEPNDQRFVNWVGMYVDPSSNDTFYFPFKYKVYLQNLPLTEYNMVLRLGEQYLIRAEAEAYGAGNGISAAIADLNVIRARAGLQPYSGGLDQVSILTAILHERQVELFTEWGQRWFDLKRTKNLNSVMGSPQNVCAEKGGIWNADWSLMPLPLSELQVNQNLNQNPGY
jgi:starch-binding outer membrane protein, SusD/RagB family